MQLKLDKVLARELAGKNISRIAQEAGISKSLLHDWVKAARYPSGKNMPQVKKLADYLGLSLEEILFDTPGFNKTIIASTTFTDNGKVYKVNIETIKK